MSLPSLYTLSHEVQSLLESDEPDALDRLGELVPDLQSKAVAVARFIESQEDFAAAIKEREAKVVALRKSVEARAARLREYLVTCLLAAEVYEIRSESGDSLKLKKNPPRVIVDDETQLPAEYWQQPPPPPPAIDKKALGSALKTGNVPGAHLEQGWRVEVV